MLVVVANALISLDVDDIAALNITANNKPIKPVGKFSNIKLRSKHYEQSRITT